MRTGFVLFLSLAMFSSMIGFILSRAFSMWKQRWPVDSRHSCTACNPRDRDMPVFCISNKITRECFYCPSSDQ